MNVTIDIKLLGFALIVIAVLVLIVFLIQLVRKLLVTLDHANKILADVEVVSEIASERTQDINGIVGDVAESAGALAKAAKEKQNVIQATTSVVKAVVSVKNAIGGDEKDKK
ncbi:MAG: hypothetical protein KBS66_03655 [Eubacterium sp.]|nr:hypothetical protein [Candidatus Colimonas fimequi]